MSTTEAQAPFHNRIQFERSIESLIEKVEKQNRGEDLDRLVGHIDSSPSDVSKLASLMMLIDDDFRPRLKADIDAYRRFEKQKGRDLGDDEIYEVLHDVYQRVRGDS